MTDVEPIISVIIPVLNESDRVVDSVEAARFAGADEIILVDGGSTDGTAELARSLARKTDRAADSGTPERGEAASPDPEQATFGQKPAGRIAREWRVSNGEASGTNVSSPGPAQVWSVESSPGRARQMNAGAAIARGDCLLFLHVDNRLAPGALDTLRRSWPSDQQAYGGFRQKIESDGRIYRWIEQGNLFRARRQRLVYGDQGLFVSRLLWERWGPFPEVELMEDFILSQRLSRTGPPIILPGPLHVDPRRWERHGPIRQTLTNWMISTAYRLGVPPARLARFYRRHDR